MKFKFSKRTLVVISLASIPVIVLVGIYFQPWKLFTDTRVEEALPQLTETTVAPKDEISDKDNEKVVEKDEPLSGQRIQLKSLILPKFLPKENSSHMSTLQLAL